MTTDLGRLLKYCFRLALTLGIVFNVCATLNVIVNRNPDDAAFDLNHRIDSDYFIKSARQMKLRGNIFIPPDYVHSVGAQVALALWFEIFPSRPFLSIKLVHFFLWILTALMMAFLVGRRLGRPVARLTTLFLITASTLYAGYVASLQYEVFLAFLGAALMWLAETNRPKPSAFLAGAIVAVACCFRVNYLLLVPLLAYFYNRRNSRAVALAFVVGFVAISAPWNLVQSFNRGIPYFYDSFTHWIFVKHLNPNAFPYSYPYAAATEPHGWQFIATFPKMYLDLLGRRVVYLTGLMPDTWFIDSRWTVLLKSAFGLPFGLAQGITVGTAMFLSILGLGSPRGNFFVPLALIAAALLPHLMIGTSTRFLVPILPPIFLLLVTGLYQLGDWFRAKFLASEARRLIPANNA